MNYGPSCMGGLLVLAEAILCAACLRVHDDLCCLVRIGAIMAWVYPSWPACSFTAELCVVYSYVGPASKESSKATCHSTHARGIIYSTVF